uniref:Uncharacterized protein n=1 Tax=Drosophila melanogaster TaxID=7227 RepID=A0A4V1D188_DROME|nr:uncharacterized protein Dmel_CG46388 [Drosophila melanogaster]QCD26200.1 uncharacterized protein Dmel_CG46388 [Drosophila melanogaster]
MCRKYHIFFALAPFMAISLAGGEPRKLIVFDTIECAIKSSVISKVVCQLYSRTEFTVFLTFGEKKHADKVFGACEVKLCPKSQKKITRINNLRLDFCQLKKHTESRSVLGMFYLALRRAVVNFPNKCPFKKNTTYGVNRFHFGWQDIPQYLPDTNYTLVGKIYANNELGLEIKVTGGYFEVANDSAYRKPLL